MPPSAPRPRIRALFAPFWAAVALVAITAGTSQLQAQAARTVRGVIRDSSTNQPLAGALVDLRSATYRATDRTDEEGNFRIRGVAPGSYQVSVLRIGYAEAKRDLEVGARDLEITVGMRPIAQRLDAFRVRGDISAIYGMVGTLPDLLPISGARVQVIGAQKEVTTDSTGGFFIPVGEPGTYMVRMTREGYAERFFPIEVPRGRAVDGSRMLDPGTAPAKGMDVLYVDLDSRLRMRATGASAIIPGAEIRRAGTQLIDAMRASQSFSARGLRFATTACLFVNGLPRPGASIDMFRPEEVESVEVYAFSGTGTADRSRNLEQAWPSGAPCGPTGATRMVGAAGGSRMNSREGNLTGPIQSGIVRYVVIWLRK
jgi:hypothetical protein